MCYVSIIFQKYLQVYPYSSIFINNIRMQSVRDWGGGGGGDPKKNCRAITCIYHITLLSREFWQEVLSTLKTNRSTLTDNLINLADKIVLGFDRKFCQHWEQNWSTLSDISNMVQPWKIFRATLPRIKCNLDTRIKEYGQRWQSVFQPWRYLPAALT